MTTTARYRCPACDAELYGWTGFSDPVAGQLVIDRCEECGLAVTRGSDPPDVDAELDRLSEAGPEGELLLRAPNRRSVQGALGGGHWAGLDPARRRLHLTPGSAELLLARAGFEPVARPSPLSLTGYLRMLETLVNGFTLKPDFARNFRAGRIRPRSGRERASFALDAVVTTLVALPMAVIALPLEALGALLGRSGELVIRARASGRQREYDRV